MIGNEEEEEKENEDASPSISRRMNAWTATLVRAMEVQNSSEQDPPENVVQFSQIKRE